MASIFHSSGLHNYSAKFSSFSPDLIAVGSCQYFGIVGNGTQFVLRVIPGTGKLQVVRYFKTNDAILDCTWSEVNPNQLISSCGNFFFLILMI